MPEWDPPEQLEEYRLVRLLGRGAMGRVYLAHDTLLDRHVAVKFVDASEGAAAKSRVFEEARAIARLQHPNVVAIYRVAEAAGHPYLVSEYVRGRSLDRIERPVAPALALSLALDLARGLAAAHRCGVLHRDVKPANAMLTDDVRGKLLDFGLARVIDASIQEPVAVPPRERVTPVRVHVDQTMDVQPRASAMTSSSVVDSINAPLTPMTSVPDVKTDDAPSNHFAKGSPPDAGTPLYMAPELWRGEPATRRSDLYALGILLYELVAGNAPHRGLGMAELGEAIQHADIPRLAEVVPGCDPALAAIIDRLVERDAGARFPSADALLTALEQCAAPTTTLAVPDGNPYRGLAVFDAAHGALFFGRRSEIRELVDRVLTEPLVIVGGDSGTGKSSVCRAGVLPFLVENAGWTRVDFVPGRRPVQSFAAALAAWSGVDEATLAGMMRDTPASVARAIRKHIVDGPDRKLLLFADQLEELLTIAEPDDAKLVADALAALAVHVPSVRVLATVRSDFLTRLAALPSLGDELGRALYFLRPLVGERLREAIVHPAAAKGVTFESEALVDSLVEQTERAPGGLPLLQFALAELWEARDTTTKTIRADALAAVGGVEGALARHADRLLAGLDAHERDAARRLLLRLVTADGTRAPRSEPELLSSDTGRGAERRALEVMVRGRIVVANNAQYEIAHEALLASWATLQEWRQNGAAARVIQKRLELATTEWDRAGRPRDLLWKRRQRAEARAIARDELGPREVEFLDAGGRAERQQWSIGIGVTALLASGAIGVGLHLRARADQQVDNAVAEQLSKARAQLETARAVTAQIDAGRARAFQLFDQDRWEEAEVLWHTEVDGRAADELKAYRDATSLFKNALAIDADRARVRAEIADLAFERFLIAERRRDTASAMQHVEELGDFGNGRYDAALAAPARVSLSVTPSTARITIERADDRTSWPSPSVQTQMTPGHVVFVVEAPGYATTRLPVLLERDKTHDLVLDLPRAESVPAGMVYIPPGTFLSGSHDETDLRIGFMNATPLHPVWTDAYLIGRHEVTIGEWIAFLDALPADQRRARTPPLLVELAPGRWRFTFARDTHTYVAEMGEPFRYKDRTKREVQDWMQFPVGGVVVDDLTHFAAWLHATRRVPNARMCTDREWERAARGADGRTYPHGAELGPDDANIDETYGRAPLAYGPDEVGSYKPSPFGVYDMSGNVWEITGSPAQPVVRGSSWYNARISARSANREPIEPLRRDVDTGIRICSTPDTSQNNAPPPSK